MSRQLSYVLFDAIGYETTNYKKAVLAELYVGRKLISELSMDYGVGQKDKIFQIEMAFADYMVEEEFEKAEKDYEARLKKQIIVEKERLKKQIIVEKERLKRESQIEKDRLKRQSQIEKSKLRLEKQRNQRTEQKRIAEFEKQIQEKKEFEKELTRLLKQDIKKIFKDEEEEEFDESLLLKRQKEEKELLYFDADKKRKREARKELDKERNKLKKSIAGRIRLFLKEHLIEQYQFWSEDREEEFVKILENMYGKTLKSLKSRADENNFKKFIREVTDVIESFDIRTPPTDEELTRALMKKLLFEVETEDKERDVLFDIPEYQLVEEKTRYYYQKSSGLNKAVRVYIYDFDKQYELTANSELDLEDIYKNLKKSMYDAVENLRRKGIIKNGKQFQVRVLIPQYDVAENIVDKYTGGNGQTMEKTGYGMSVPSNTFSVQGFQNHMNNLIEFMEKRLSSYLTRNMGSIHSQFISGFMISVEI